jgi:predicted porin
MNNSLMPVMPFFWDNKMKIIIALLLIMMTSTANAVEIYDKETGKYLGQLGGNQYAPDSTNNPYGQYGSKYSADSINNPYGTYGSQYSNSSPNNPYATNPPVIIDPKK